MAISLVSNISSLIAQRNVGQTQATLQTCIQRLSSGLRINQASDDPGGLAVSSVLSATLASLQQANLNAQSGVSLAQTADSSMGSISSLLTQMRALAVQSSSNGSLSDADRATIDAQFQALLTQIDSTVAMTQYNGVSLINGTFSAGISFQVGPYNSTSDVIAFNIGQVGTSSSGLNLTSTSVNTVSNANAAINRVDAAVAQLASVRGFLGAGQSRLSSSIDTLNALYTNTSAGNSAILDVDVAAETALLAQTQILLQAGLTVLSQANSLPSLALTLLPTSR